MTEETGTEISEVMDNGFKYSKDDILQMCNVSERTFRSFLAMQLISQRDFTSIGPRKIIKNYMQKAVK